MINSTRCMSGLWRYGGGLRTRSRLAAFASRTSMTLLKVRTGSRLPTCVTPQLRAGNATSELYVTEIGHDTNGWFLDQHDAKITALFKLYPWEDLLREPFAGHLMETKDRIKWFEPAWKAILSNKAFLAAIWQLFPDHPLLLPAYLGDPQDLTHYAKKPLFGREGDMVLCTLPKATSSTPRIRDTDLRDTSTNGTTRSRTSMETIRSSGCGS